MSKIIKSNIVKTVYVYTENSKNPSHKYIINPDDCLSIEISEDKEQIIITINSDEWDKNHMPF